MSPKNLLRSKACRSNLSEFDDVKGHPGFDKQGTRFKRLIKDRNAHSNVEEGIRRLVLCSGKVCGFYNYILYIWSLSFNIQLEFQYFPSMLLLTIKTNFPLQVYYELDDQRNKFDASDVAICRVEQLCPFPYDLVQRELKRYPSMYL
jgi:2-oxoglutarate dehydrogenase E1 component